MSETTVEKSRKYVEDEGSYLSLLSHELYLNFFGKYALVNIMIACHMCHQLRQLPV